MRRLLDDVVTEIYIDWGIPVARVREAWALYEARERGPSGRVRGARGTGRVCRREGCP